MDNVELFSPDAIKIVLTILTGVAAGGWALLKMTGRVLEKQQEANRRLFNEKFAWAEKLRQDSRGRWERHFQKVEDRLERAFNLMDSMDRRVTIIEICLRRAPCGKLLDSDIPPESCDSILRKLDSERPESERPEVGRRYDDP